MTETTVRTIGGALQLAGVFLVAAGVWQTRRRFTQRPGVVGTLTSAGRTALSRVRQLLPRRRRGQVVEVGLAAEIESSSSVSATLTSRFDGLNFEQLRSKLESLVNGLRGEIEATRQLINEEAEKRTRGLEVEREAREAADQALLARLETFAGSNLRLEAWGALSFLVGIALATWAPEAAGLLS